MSHQIGPITSTEHGTSYWIRNAEDVRAVTVSGGKCSIRRAGSEIRLDVDIVDCAPVPGHGIRPRNPITVELGLEGKKKETLVLA